MWEEENGSFIINVVFDTDGMLMHSSTPAASECIRLPDQLADLVRRGHHAGPPLSMRRRPFRKHQAAIETWQNEANLLLSGDFLPFLFGRCRIRIPKVRRILLGRRMNSSRS
jgi:hypothetical protein